MINKNKNITLSVFLTLVYAFGVFCLIWLAIPYISHDTTVNNPDAMLPLEKWDGAGMCLLFGFFPLLAASVLEYLFAWHDREKGRGRSALRLLLFIPPVVCLCLVIHYLIISF